MNKTPLLEFVYNRKKTAATNIGMYFAYQIVKAEAKAEAIKNKQVKLKE